MFLWRKITTPSWIESCRAELEAIPPERIAIIERPGFKRVSIEASCASRIDADRLRKKFGGEVQQLGKNWLTTFTKTQKRRPLAVGKRLIIYDDEKQRRRGASVASLIIPSGAAFGTGDHPTTAMSLRLLEEATRKLNPGWSLADLGSGTGILGLAARRLGAQDVEAIDLDPMAISTAKANAQLNAIRGIKFRVLDVHKWIPARRLDIVTANLFSQLLIGVLQQVRRSLKPGGRFIFSGIMRSEEANVTKAVGKSGLRLETVRRRGKWIACSGGL